MGLWLKVNLIISPCFLTVYGNLPFQSQLADWEFAISQHSAVPQGILVCFLSFGYIIESCGDTYWHTFLQLIESNPYTSASHVNLGDV